jgi:acetoin utilization protein AcuB
MLAKGLLSDIVPPLKTSDTGDYALHLMEIFRLSHLPIVNNKDFLGLISEDDIYNLNVTAEPIGNHSLSLAKPYVKINQHIYEVIDVASTNKLSVVPVLEENGEYLGLITIPDILKYVADLFALKQPGGILILEMNMEEYSLSQISQIVESNDANILSLYISGDGQKNKIEINLKINKIDLTRIIQTFERYEYTIKASYMEHDDMEELYNDRFESLMKYLDV